MIEEMNGLQSTQPAAAEEISFGRKVAAFLLTLLLIPFLFAGACFGVLAIFTTKVPAFTIFSGIAVLVTLSFVGIRTAIRTKNPGLRWGIIVVGVVVVAAIGVFLLILFGH